jgi:hypothetical protein
MKLKRFSIFATTSILAGALWRTIDFHGVRAKVSQRWACRIPALPRFGCLQSSELAGRSNVGFPLVLRNGPGA